jgi:kumamolisin
LLRKHVHSPRAHGGVVIPLLLLALVMSGASPWPAAGRTVPIPGNQFGVPPGARVLGPLPAGRLLRLIVGLSVRHPAVLAAFLHARRAWPLSRPTLTPAQFAARFSPTPAEEEAVAAYLRAHGLRILRTYPDRLLLDVAGTARQVEAAFGVSLVSYRDRHGHLDYANTTPPRLPLTVAGLVGTVVGLRDDGRLRHAPAPRSWHHGRVPRPATWASPTARHEGCALACAARTERGPRPASAATWASPTAGRRPASGPAAPPAGLLTPAQLRAAYDVTPIYSATFTTTSGLSQTAAITGAGQTVALFELSPYDPADIAAYDAAFGLSATLPLSVPVDGGATDAFGATGRGEAALDIELVQAVAPGAQILVYSGPAAPNDTDNTSADDTYARIVNDNRAQVLSTSWGQCEPDQLAATPPDVTLLHNLFAQAVAEGMTVVAASGDEGANDCTDGRSNPSVDYPASDPYVIGVGGSTLSLDAAGGVLGESGWAGSGGGTSAVWPRPAWQAGPGVPAGTQRLVPDVALDAGTGYAVWVAGGWTPVHGTSGGPPVWAALLALANQARYVAAAARGAPTPAPCAVLPGLGDVHPELYQLGATPAPPPVFRDITLGPGNGVATPGPGWDGVTGWGVPDGYALLRALLAMPALAAPAPGPCPTATPMPPTGTPTPLSSAAPARPTPGRATSSVPARRMASPVTVRAVPARVEAGGVVLLQLRGAPGAGRTVTFELRYPDRRSQRVRQTTSAHGTAQLRVHVLHLRPGDRAMVVRLRATMRGGRRALVTGTNFQILPPPAHGSHGSREHHGHATSPTARLSSRGA